MSLLEHTEDQASRHEGSYRIGTVANLTGLHHHTIRAWERRYGAIEPERTPGGSRLYSDEDVERLQLMKAITECGEPISAVAHLDNQEVRERLRRLAGLRAPAGEPVESPDAMPMTPRVAVLGVTLAEQFRSNPGVSAQLPVVAREAHPESFADSLRDKQADVLILDFEALGRRPIDALARLRDVAQPRLILALYSFARRDDLAQLAKRGVKLLRSPVSIETLRRTILDHLVIEQATRNSPERPVHEARAVSLGDHPERLFSDAQLARLLEISSTVECECPTHLSSIVSSLVSFERYAQACENRNTEDAALHASLAEGTAEARAIMERLLVKVCEFDRISLD